jgi:ABC-type Na+ efflux pump permease subunit
MTAWNVGPRQQSGVSDARRRGGVAGVVAGVVLLGVALLVLILPFGLFLLGGGGDGDRFSEILKGFLIAAAVIAALGVAALTFGIAAVSSSRRGAAQ